MSGGIRAGSGARRLAMLGVVIVLMTACQRAGTPEGTSQTSPAASPTASPSPVPSPSPSPSPAAGVNVQAVDSNLGRILADAQGRTLYVFLRDTEGTSNCNDACAQTWPPLMAAGTPQAGEGVNAALLGAGQRQDGSSQVTYNRRPLYHYSGDQAPGETKGQGFAGNWFVVSPAGEPVN